MLDANETVGFGILLDKERMPSGVASAPPICVVALGSRVVFVVRSQCFYGSERIMYDGVIGVL